MGASASKVAVADKFVELSERPNIPEADDIWYALLSPVSDGNDSTDAEFLTLLGAEITRRIRDQQPDNFRLLLDKVTARLEGLLRPQVAQGAVASQISHCCRLLARIFPLIYENGGDEAFEHVWVSTDIGCRVVDTLRILIQFPGYTEAIALPKGASKVWTMGVGCALADEHSVDYVKARASVLTALVAVLSEPMYRPQVEWSACLDHWVSTADPAVFCSLFNWALRFPRKLWNNDHKSSLSSLCLHVLVVSIVHQSSETNQNQFAALLGRVCQNKDLKWITTVLLESFEYPHNTALWISLLWEFISRNKCFLQQTELSRFVQPLLERATRDPDDTNLARLAAFTLFALTESSTGCAAVAGRAIFEYLVNNKPLLEQPSVEVATLVDAFWNCAPAATLTSGECAQFNELCVDNRDVSEYLNALKTHMLANNPSINAEPATEPWTPISFSWDAERRKWYLAVIYGSVYGGNLRIFGKTHVTLFKVDRLPRDTIIELPSEVLNSASEMAAGVMKSAATSLGIN